MELGRRPRSTETATWARSRPTLSSPAPDTQGKYLMKSPAFNVKRPADALSTFALRGPLAIEGLFIVLFS